METTNTDKWEFLLERMPNTEPYVKEQIAILLDNQVKLNKVSNPKPPEGACSSWDQEAWNRVSIPAIVRVFKDSILFDLISVQALSYPSGKFCYKNVQGEEELIDISSVTRQMGREMWHPANGFQTEIDKLIAFIIEYKNKLVAEVIGDLENNCGSVLAAKYKNSINFINLLYSVSDSIGEKTGHSANWMIASPAVVNLLRYNISDWQDEGNCNVKYRGKFLNWKVYESLHQPRGKILMGYKSEDHHQSGYYFCPYMPFIHTPGWWKSDGTHCHTTTTRRYGKCLKNSDYYGKLELSGLEE